MKIIELPVKDIIPYERNPRKNDKAVDAVAESIKQFGFKVPCVVDSNHVLVTGHTRVKACKKLGIKTVPCVVADDLTEDQIKAFRLADNKVSELADWDTELLADELLDIDLDMEGFGFSLEDYVPSEEHKPYGEERARTFEIINLDKYDAQAVAGKYDMPTLKACDHVPTDIVSFNYVMNTDAFEKGVHFFIDDYQFERIWNDPDKYMYRLGLFDCVFTPDFSLYLDMPIAMQIWNVYRSRLLGQTWQKQGFKVIPTLSWSDERSYDFCFDGLPETGTFAVSTVGVMRDAEAKRIWTEGMTEALKRVKPTTLICYGTKIDFSFGCEVKYIDNHNVEWGRK